MSKTPIRTKTTKKDEPGPAAPSYGRLDEAITKATSHTVQGIVKYRVVLISLIVAVVLIGVSVTVVTNIREAGRRALAGRTFQLFDSPSARASDPVARFAEINELLADARGEPGERGVYKSAVAFLVGHARKAIASEATGPDTGAAATSPAPESPVKPDQVPTLLEKAKEIVLQGGTLFPEDEDFQTWSAASLRAVEGVDETVRRKRAGGGEKRGFGAVLPPRAAPSGSGEIGPATGGNPAEGIPSDGSAPQGSSGE